MEPDDLLCSRNARSRTPLVGRAQLRIDQATLEKEIENWKYACALDHPSRPFVEATMVVRCGLLGTSRILAGLGWVGEKRTAILSTCEGRGDET
jgi:hypothetical protein